MLEPLGQSMDSKPVHDLPSRPQPLSLSALIDTESIEPLPSIGYLFSVITYVKGSEEMDFTRSAEPNPAKAPNVRRKSRRHPTWEVPDYESAV